MKKEFDLFIAQYELKNFPNTFVAIKWLANQSAKPKEVEFLTNYGFHRLANLGGNVCEITVKKIIQTNEED